MERYTTMQFSIGDWEVTTMVDGLPSLYNEYLSHANFVNQIELKDTDQSGVWFIGLRNVKIESNQDWPTIVIAQRYEPSGCGFPPGALLTPDTSVLFLGAGTRILIFNLETRKLVSEDYVAVGFWGWEQHESIVLMSSELEFAAWDNNGRKLWSKSVEPPWSYKSIGNKINLDIMGQFTQFDIKTGR
jgi:hypothetical protein